MFVTYNLQKEDLVDPERDSGLIGSPRTAIVISPLTGDGESPIEVPVMVLLLKSDAGIVRRDPSGAPLLFRTAMIVDYTGVGG